MMGEGGRAIAEALSRNEALSEELKVLKVKYGDLEDAVARHKKEAADERERGRRLDKEVWDAKSQLKVLTAEVQQGAERVASLEEELRAAQKTLEEAKEETREATDRAMAAEQRGDGGAGEQIAAQSAQISQMEVAAEQAAQKCEELERELLEAHGELSKLRPELSELRAAQASSELGAELLLAKERLDAEARRADGAEAAQAELEGQIASANAEIASVNAEIASANAEITRLKEFGQELERANAELAATSGQKVDDTEAVERVQSLQKAVDEQKKTLAAQEAELQRTHTESARIAAEVVEARSILKQALTKLAGEVRVAVEVSPFAPSPRWQRRVCVRASERVRAGHARVCVANVYTAEPTFAPSSHDFGHRSTGCRFVASTHLPFRQLTCGPFTWQTTNEQSLANQVRKLVEMHEERQMQHKQLGDELQQLRKSQVMLATDATRLSSEREGALVELSAKVQEQAKTIRKLQEEVTRLSTAASDNEALQAKRQAERREHVKLVAELRETLKSVGVLKAENMTFKEQIELLVTQYKEGRETLERMNGALAQATQALEDVQLHSKAQRAQLVSTAICSLQSLRQHLVRTLRGDKKTESPRTLTSEDGPFNFDGSTPSIRIQTLRSAHSLPKFIFASKPAATAERAAAPRVRGPHGMAFRLGLSADASETAMLPDISLPPANCRPRQNVVSADAGMLASPGGVMGSPLPLTGIACMPPITPNTDVQSVDEPDPASLKPPLRTSSRASVASLPRAQLHTPSTPSYFGLPIPAYDPARLQALRVLAFEAPPSLKPSHLQQLASWEAPAIGVSREEAVAMRKATTYRSAHVDMAKAAAKHVASEAEKLLKLPPPSTVAGSS